MSSLTPANLRCEYLTDPLAIERMDPRLSWISIGSGRNARQTAYRVIVARSEADLLAGRALLWDSGKVDSDASAHIHYAGAPLASFDRCCWRVQVWDEVAQPSAWSATAHWAMGIQHISQWPARWVFSPLNYSSNSPYLRRAFSVGKKVVDARLYATACGIYVAWLNGQPVSDEQLAPGWTDYNKRFLYRCYDVTSLVAQNGDNVLAAQLNDGWFKGPIGWKTLSCRWGDRVQFLALLRLVHEDGSVTMVTTDDQWRTANSPILTSTFLRGEVYDATQETVGWLQPGFDDSSWHKMMAIPINERIALQAHAGPPVRALQELKAVKRWQPRPGVWIFDLGQNFAGVARIKVRAPAGATIRMRHGEMVTPDRQLYVDNLRHALSTDYYTASGNGEEVWQPRFTFHGFQYVEISGLTGEPALDTVTGVVLGSDCPSAGTFSCSEPMINQLYSNIVWTQRSNYIDIPTDCPQRDERLGWTGDAQAYIRTAICTHDIASFFTKWEQDLRDAQGAEGYFPHTAPVVPGMEPELARGDAAWGDAGTICPMTMYRCYGDRDQLAAMYPAMVRWADYLQKSAVSPHNIRYRGENVPILGDWLNVDSPTAFEIIATAFFAHSTQLVSEAARILGKNDDADRYSNRFVRIKQAFVREFVHDDGRVFARLDNTETQTAYLLALHFDLMPSELRAAAVDHLIDNIRKHDWHLTTGFVGLPYLLPVLSASGRSDVAFRLLNNKTYPSWLYPITQGATTIWERWNGWHTEQGPADPGMNSYSHYAYGALGEWLFSDVAGIDLIDVAFKRIRVRPRIGGGLTHAEATHQCIHGRIASAWKLEGDTVILSVEIPANTTAQIWIPTDDPKSLRENGAAWAGTVAAQPGYALIDVGSGTYQFTAKAAPVKEQHAVNKAKG
jgi:alpha-L-rhamnosidase